MKENIYDGSHFLTQEEQRTYLKLNEENWREAVIYLRNIWNSKKDKKFMKKFTLIHWLSLMEFENFFQNINLNKEICCQGYLDFPYNCSWLGGVGVIIEGEIMLAGNGDLQTNQLISLTNQTGGLRYTMYASRLFIDEKTLKNPFEFIVGKNWKISKLIIDIEKASTYRTYEEDLIKFKTLAKKLKLEIIDINGNLII